MADQMSKENIKNVEATFDWMYYGEKGDWAENDECTRKIIRNTDSIYTSSFECACLERVNGSYECIGWMYGREACEWVCGYPKPIYHVSAEVHLDEWDWVSLGRDIEADNYNDAIEEFIDAIKSEFGDVDIDDITAERRSS